MTSTFPPLAQAIAGSLGAATANIGAYPLDLITTKIQIAPSYKKKKIQGELLHSVFNEGTDEKCLRYKRSHPITQRNG